MDPKAPQTIRTIQTRPDGDRGRARALHRRWGRVRVTIVDGPSRGHTLEWTAGLVRGGRSRVNELVIDDGSVSAAHFELRLEGERVLLRDLGSTNGTWIAGVRIREVWIEPGACFTAGRCQLRFEAVDEVEVEVSTEGRFEQLLGDAPRMRELFATLERIAATPMDVLITGETGTGKELAARAIHARSGRSDAPFVVLDCAALPRELAEATILGHRRGAFTGAVESRAGVFEDAHGGTVFLDEIGELPLELQPKLLRVLERREVTRIGEGRARPVDVRVLAATHRDLRRMVGDGEFRDDLYFRIADIRVELPPLRARGEDVVLIARNIVDALARQHGRALTLDDDALAHLRAHSWPGNVRELVKTMRRAVFMASGGAVTRRDLTLGAREPEAPRTPAADAELAELCALPLREARDAFEREYLRRLFQDTGGNLSEAARRIDYSRQGLRDLLRRLGIYDDGR